VCASLVCSSLDRFFSSNSFGFILTRRLRPFSPISPSSPAGPCPFFSPRWSSRLLPGRPFYRLGFSSSGPAYSSSHRTRRPTPPTPTTDRESIWRICVTAPRVSRCKRWEGGALRSVPDISRRAPASVLLTSASRGRNCSRNSTTSAVSGSSGGTGGLSFTSSGGSSPACLSSDLPVSICPCAIGGTIASSARAGGGFVASVCGI
jgi:hypothetical protein